MPCNSLWAFIKHHMGTLHAKLLLMQGVVVEGEGDDNTLGIIREYLYENIREKLENIYRMRSATCELFH